MSKALIIILSFATGISLLSCGSSKRYDFALNDAGYIIKRVENSPGSIDPSISYFYVTDFNSLSDPDNYINLIFECDLQIAACCRDLKQNERGKDFNVDIYFNKNSEKCLSPEILTKQKSISFEKDKKIELNIFKVKSDYCKCSGSYTSLSDSYKDINFILPYNLNFLKFDKNEIKEIKKQLK